MARWLFCLFFLWAVPAMSQAVFSNYPDIPLPPGMHELSSTVQDSVILLEAAGSASPEMIRRFYGEALPRQGWRAEGGNAYHRHGMVLTMNILRGGGMNRLKINVASE